ncbi:hypothetical protein ACW0JT_18310 [Arthrobacter sp. SA17]
MGGAIAAIGGSASTAFVFPSLLALPAFTAVGSFPLQLAGSGIAIAIAFILTFVFGPRSRPTTPRHPPLKAPPLFRLPRPAQLP